MTAADEKAALKLVITLHRPLHTLRRPGRRSGLAQLVVLALLNPVRPIANRGDR